MKIATFNINGLTARQDALLRWLDESRPDVACLQELKAPQERFPEAAVRGLGYGVIWHGQKSWNGVAILARGADPIERRRVLPGDPDDLHSRYIEATVGSGAAEIVVGCLYLPNGNPAPAPSSNTSCDGSSAFFCTLPTWWPKAYPRSSRATTT
jgi:exodeoxyribonuclease-3